MSRVNTNSYLNGLRISIKAIKDTMGPSGLVLSLLEYVVLATFPGLSKVNLKQKQIFEALKLARDEMETIIAVSGIIRALRFKYYPLLNT